MAAPRKGNKVSLKAKGRKKTRQGTGKFTKRAHKGSEGTRISKRYKKSYRGQGR